MLIMILVAFFILCERKFLGYIQLRKGPKKVGVVGLFQSFADLLKLLLKFNVFGYTVRRWFGGLVVSSIISYGVLIKFRLIGGIRRSFSGVRFEAVFMCLVLVLGELYGDYKYQSCGSVVLLFPIFYYIWWVSILGEKNRAPLDFGESERELVSGFNTEYRGVPFMIIFACEGLFMVDFSLIVLLHLVMYIWFRGTFPRIRYNDYVFLLWRWGLVISLFGVLVLYNL
ncbi:unnamed protein product [Trichobilharzia regenti]|nr:unnamed protein product [Trichobilharzia regenti]